MISSQSLGDFVPYSLITTFPFLHRSKKGQKSRFMMVGSTNIDVWNVAKSANAKSVGSLQGHASQVITPSFLDLICIEPLHSIIFVIFIISSIPDTLYIATLHFLNFPRFYIFYIFRM